MGTLNRRLIREMLGRRLVDMWVSGLNGRLVGRLVIGRLEETAMFIVRFSHLESKGRWVGKEGRRIAGRLVGRLMWR